MFNSFFKKIRLKSEISGDDGRREATPNPEGVAFL